MTTNGQKMRRITILLDPAVYEQLAAVKDQQGSSIAALTRRGIRQVIREARERQAAALMNTGAPPHACTGKGCRHVN